LRVTAAIPAYNASAYLGDAIRSVQAQTFACFECLVVDDGSTDETAEIARSFEGVRCFTQVNGGDANARNRAISEATGEYIAFLDADDVWKPEKIERQLQMFQADPALAMVYTGVEVVDQHLNHLESLNPALGSAALRNTLVVEKPYMTGVGSTGLVRAPVARAIGFDPRLRASADWAFACHVALKHKVGAVQAPLILYRQHAESQVHRNLAAVERDMRLVWSEIFHHPDLDPQIKRLQKRALANLHLSLAASYFKNEERLNFIRHLGRALTLRPDRVVAALWRRYRVPPS
jgi:glycosyltransferase involved in cell wall biosynthesis